MPTSEYGAWVIGFQKETAYQARAAAASRRAMALARYRLAALMKSVFGE